MRYGIALSVGLMCLCALTASSEALAKSSRNVRSEQPAGAANREGSIPLPSNLTSNDDFLDVGDDVPVGTTDRYDQEQTYGNQDPLRFTEAGSVLDQFE